MRESLLRFATVALAVLMPCLVCAQSSAGASLQELRQMSARFVRTPLVVDTRGLTAGDHKALVKLIEAARVIDDIYLQQLWRGDVEEYQHLRKDHSTLGRARLHYFWLNKGPWSALDNEKAFLPGVPARKPLGAAFYPEDMSAADFEAWAATLPPKDADQA